ncbi:MAG: tetratricopeptide repeat protein [Acidobacteria bacterium]|nr:tetratricopeptide repeat protein [Acidobacteriota bacterium]
MKGRVLVWPVLGLLLAGLVAQTCRFRGRLLASQLINQVEAITIAAAGAGPGAVARVLPLDMAELRRAGEADPLAVEVPLSRGSLLLLAQRPDEAIAAYRSAIALEPHPEIYLHLGDALLAAGQLEEARRSYRIAVRLDPWLQPSVPAGVL